MDYLGGPPGRAAESIFRLVVRIRGKMYDRGLLPVHRLPVPVISVGNLLVGGTGKTPVVMAVADRLAARGQTVVVLSRGYGREDAGRMLLLGAGDGEGEEDARFVGDEPALFHRRLPHVPIVLSRDRVAGGKEAVARIHPDWILLDDGMQHRRIARDVELVLLSGLRPFGNGRLLPRGPLREPPSAIARADRVLVNTTEGEEEGLEGALDRLGAPPRRTRFRYEPDALIEPSGSEAEIDSLRGRKVLSVSAIGNPSSFETSLRSLGAELVGTLRYRDHHRFTPKDCEKIAREGARLSAVPVTTEKDRVRFPAGALAASKIHTLRIDVVFVDGGEWIDRLRSTGERT